ncbi:MAG: bifunctional 23S rRNA (guanine(2069)-N(7))-methyltransferase RlmK/23S rRNA (guanine(2445)-N(2))-methyltransferase RlmL [Moraxellaceae bacterium]|nr:bifunctional 23S rRNA (guanine(2069)-N(7))-methyltransferase RlmK/23S rRNA (guanine(2445)-N(2))-methyltransferase RlmL [Moraxellaceae bacterium]
MTAKTFNLIVTCADGLEYPLQTELSSFSINSEILSTGRLAVILTLEQLYHICLWSRVASRVLLPIKKKNINTDYDIAEQLYSLGQSVDWTEQFSLENSFSIRTSVDKRVPVNQQFAMLRIKDAIADSFNKKFNERPNVNSKNPDIQIFTTISGKKESKTATAEVFIDLSGTSLHRRGYRKAMTDAPLKENLASALLYEVGFHKKNFDALIDPMCGSGTLLIEALLMLANYPVGMDKADSQFGFYAWQHHNNELWEQTVTTAQDNYHQRLQQLTDGEIKLPKIYGFDSNPQAIKATHKNFLSAGLGELLDKITLKQRPLNQLNSALTEDFHNGKFQRPLIITNPPYGERLGGEDRVDVIRPLYQAIGLKLQSLFAENSANATLGVLAMQVEQADTLPLNNPQTLRCHNGAITVYFRHGQLTAPVKNLIETYEKQEIQIDEAQEFVNRLQKNLAQLRKKATRQGVTNLRLYDADLPNFKVAIDLYGNYLHVQEYAPPKKIPVETAKKRFNLALQGIREVLAVNREQVFIKTRAKQSGKEQYSKQARKKGKQYIVQENGAYFYVNFTDYLDTGLFIDHRNMREMIKNSSKNKRVLNLFAYTCTASVHSALAGASQVTSVDLSANYLDWGKQNFALNGLDLTEDKYQFIASDIFTWIKENTEQYDVIFIDPPTFSNSKKFYGTFDVQRDHSALINRALNRLASGGVLYFSNNFTKFIMDENLKKRYDIKDVTQKTIGFDFNIKKPIHRSFEIRHKSNR